MWCNFLVLAHWKEINLGESSVQVFYCKQREATTSSSTKKETYLKEKTRSPNNNQNISGDPSLSTNTLPRTQAESYILLTMDVYASTLGEGNPHDVFFLHPMASTQASFRWSEVIWSPINILATRMG